MGSIENYFESSSNEESHSFYPAVLHGAVAFMSFMFVILAFKTSDIMLGIGAGLIALWMTMMTVMVASQIRNAKVAKAFAQADRVNMSNH